MVSILGLVAGLLAAIGGISFWVHVARGAPRFWELGKRLLETSIGLGLLLLAWGWIRG